MHFGHSHTFPNMYTNKARAYVVGDWMDIVSADA